MQTLSLNLSNPASSRDTLWIEQEQPGQADGYLSRAGMYRSIMALLNQEMPDEPECVNECVVTLYVYRYDLALAYRLDVSHGSLGARIIEDDLYYTEKIKVSMEDEIKLKYPCFGVVESRWLGDVVYDQDGMQTVAPSFVAGVEKVKFASPVYGTFVATYRIHRDKYLLSLPKRETAIENKYSSFAYALFAGGFAWLGVDPPAGVEQTDMVCTGGGGSTSITGPADGRNIPVAAYADKRTEIDYCSQLAEDPTYTEHVDWEQQEI